MAIARAASKPRLAPRDYLSDLESALDAFVPDGDYVAAEVAQAFVDHLGATDPDLLIGWWHTSRVVILTQVISHRRRLHTRHARSQAVRGAFANAADRYDRHLTERRTGARSGSLGGDPAPLSLFAQHLVVNGQNLARPIGQMTRQDCEYVADQHRRRARTAKAEEAFFGAVAARIPDDGVLADVFTVEAYIQLRDSFATL